MKSKKVKNVKRISPEEALDFLESFKKMSSGLDEKTQLISLRVPANILRAYKIKARAEDKPYQRLMMQALREFFKE